MLHRTAKILALSKRWWPAILLAAFIAVRFAKPIDDGDLFWQMKYASQMADHGTLHTSHSLYSWMPASNSVIYCAWLGQFLLLGLWKAAGAAGIFALRYAAVLGVVALLALHARRCGMMSRAETWLVMLATLLGSAAATSPKPELLSLVLWNGLLFCCFGMLLSPRRLPWIYALPVIMVVWVNTHGGFILAAPLLVVQLAAGWLLFPRRDAKHLTFATILCGLATVVNPYGLRYPAQLLTWVLGRPADPDLAWNNAYQSVLDAGGRYLHLPELFVCMAVVMLVLVVRSRATARFALAAVFALYLPLSIVYVRSAYLLPAIFGYAAIYLAREFRPRIRVSAVSAWAFAVIACAVAWQTTARPAPGSWTGFGISDLQPVAEAEFVASHHLGPRLYNTYNAGSYLLWRLSPGAQVMVDARSFPYLSWFPELVEFSRTRDRRRFQAFLDRHPADVAVVDFQEEQTWRSFLQTPGWRPAFYGPSAAVFVKSAEVAVPPEAAPSLQHLRNGDTASRVFSFAIASGDYDTAWAVLDQMKGTLRSQIPADTLAFASAYFDAQQSLRAHEYTAAWNNFARAFDHHASTGRDETILYLLHALVQTNPMGPQAATLRAGIDHLIGQKIN